MQRLAVIAKLKPDAEKRAEDLIERGPPFSPQESGFERHTVFLSGDYAVFVFEGGRFDQLLNRIIRQPSSVGALREWDGLVERMPKLAREAYFWHRGDEWP